MVAFSLFAVNTKMATQGGYIPDLGWEQAGGEITPAVVGIVYRLLERRRAGCRPGYAGEAVNLVGTGQAQGLPLQERCGGTAGKLQGLGAGGLGLGG